MLKKIILFTIIAMNSYLLRAQNVASCCSTNAVEAFAMFASNKDFASAHLNPLPYVHESDQGKMITFKTKDGNPGNAYFLANKKKTNKYVLVFQEWWGLNDHIKREAEKLFNDLGNVNVIAIDMYDGKVATNREEASKYMGEFDKARGESLIMGAMDFAGKGARFATIGWCFGGGLSLQAAILAENKAAACVIYYGMPESDEAKLKKLKADVLGIYGSKDQWITPELVENFKKNMEKAGKKLEVKMYDQDHAFANPSNPGFDKDATVDAYNATVEFLKKKL